MNEKNWEIFPTGNDFKIVFLSKDIDLLGEELVIQNKIREINKRMKNIVKNIYDFGYFDK
jgi:hypothetical protein